MIKQIAEHLGFHPATVSSWLKNGGRPPKRSVPEEDLVDARWQARIGALLSHNADLQSSSIAGHWSHWLAFRKVSGTGKGSSEEFPYVEISANCGLACDLGRRPMWISRAMQRGIVVRFDSPTCDRLS
jgi:hypothetical protein